VLFFDENGETPVAEEKQGDKSDAIVPDASITHDYFQHNCDPEGVKLVSGKKLEDGKSGLGSEHGSENSLFEDLGGDSQLVDPAEADDHRKNYVVLPGLANRPESPDAEPQDRQDPEDILLKISNPDLLDTFDEVFWPFHWASHKCQTNTERK